MYHLALPSNIRLGWRGLSGTNTSLLRTFINYDCKKFYNVGPLSAFARFEASITKTRNVRIGQILFRFIFSKTFSFQKLFFFFKTFFFFQNLFSLQICCQAVVASLMTQHNFIRFETQVVS
jgi:hypothetical protein